MHTFVEGTNRETTQALTDNRRRAPRIKKDVPCVVAVGGGRQRRMRIVDISRTGLLLVWEQGMDRSLEKGQELYIRAEFDGRYFQLQGVVARLQFTDGVQYIGVDGLKWSER